MVQGCTRIPGDATKLRCGWKHRPSSPIAALLFSIFSMILLGAQYAPQSFAEDSRAAPVAGSPPDFEVATVKPSKPGRWRQDIDETGDRLTIQSFTLRRLIREAYGLKSDSQIIGGPEWVNDQRFDIVAKVDDAEAARIGKMSDKQSDKEWALMLQSLLADRFQLKVTREQRTLPVFALVVAHSRPKMKRTPTNGANGQGGDPGIDIDWDELTARAASMDEFADSLTSLRDLNSRVVLNRTDLRGNFDFQLHWARDRGDDASTDSPYPEIFTALEEQLGLKLKAAQAIVDVVVVQSTTQPGPN
jgi:uncharacterized protein (TIGR03435 family)